jgi:hypothetical protein
VGVTFGNKNAGETAGWKQECLGDCWKREFRTTIGKKISREDEKKEWKIDVGTRTEGELLATQM